MNANELADKYRTSPVIQDLLKAGKHIEAIKELRNHAGCFLRTAKEAVDIIKGGDNAPKLFTFTQGELDDMIVRNAIDRLMPTTLEREALKRKGLID